MKKTRRVFIKNAGIATVGLVSGTSALTACQTTRILGANDTINVGIVGLNGRGGGLMGSLLKQANARIVALCDVDRNVLENRVGQLKEKGISVRQFEDFRKMIEMDDLDVVFIASADHTHTPFSVYALQAGKHVYCEKPCSQNAEEGFLLVEAQKKYGKHVQIGNQQRSAPTSQQAIKDINDGIIGEAYEGRGWYANSRGTIGNGKNIAVPEHLNWDLWQGPAPRRPLMSNYVHYNWHWFKHWGTGEINNNGMHEMDVCRWALGGTYPTVVTSQGGRFHYTDDDWEFFDTQIARFEFEGGKSFSWDGRSCNGFPQYERGRGVMIYGTEGSILLDRNDYYVFDRGGKEVKHLSEDTISQTTQLAGTGGLTDKHIHNFFEAIRTSIQLHAPVSDANVSNHLCHLGNIAQFHGGRIEIDPNNGHIVGNDAAHKEWGRTYEPGWAPKLN